MPQQKSTFEKFFSDKSKGAKAPAYGVWAAFLSAYVEMLNEGRTTVHYGDVSTDDHNGLKTFIAAMQLVNPAALSRADAFAFWANIYNALTVDIVLDHYPVKSIKAIRSGITPGPWRRKLFSIGGEQLTLDNIEHDILRAFWGDNRVHYALNCGSIGCPNLLPQPFVGETLDDTLDQAATEFINHPRSVDFIRGRLVASSIYSWYKEDFRQARGGVLGHFQKYAAPELKNALGSETRISRHTYDWSLNDR
ncbi:MAG: DUF547 domain-containing protein [Pseudomonadota bacterium]